MTFSDENLMDRIRDLIGNNSHEKLNILQEQIDVDLQMEYFEFSKQVKKDLNPAKILSNKGKLFLPETNTEEKKKLIAELASIENVEAFRALEKFVAQREDELKGWGILGFQESRMLLESKLLDENRVFISTGLGGKGLKLRYFIVFIAENRKPFTKSQEKIIRSETEFVFKRYNAEMESIDYGKNFASVLALIPVTIPVREVFSECIAECNQLGSFLDTNYVITNVKVLTKKEISERLNEPYWLRNE